MKDVLSYKRRWDHEDLEGPVEGPLHLLARYLFLARFGAEGCAEVADRRRDEPRAT